MASLQPRDVAYASAGAGAISVAHAAAHRTFGEAGSLGAAAVGKAGIAVAVASFGTLLVAVGGR
jgi:hypothetical protein